MPALGRTQVVSSEKNPLLLKKVPHIGRPFKTDLDAALLVVGLSASIVAVRMQAVT